VLAHSPLGGPKRAARLARDPALVRAAERLGVTPQQALLRGLVEMHPRIVALPGATRPETARAAAAAARLALDEETRGVLAARLGTPWPPRPAARSDGEVVLIAGISGAGKSTLVTRFDGYARLNRDERGGTLAGIAAALDAQLAAGARRVVLDNTYVTRASRSDVIRVAARHNVAVRCLWLDTPLVEAQRNAIERMLAAHGRLLAPEELGSDPTRIAPRVQLAQTRALEPPSVDEGFSAVEIVRFAREMSTGGPGRAVALEALLASGPAVLAPGCLVFAWLPEGDAPLVAATAGLDVERAACTHPGGPPRCWCRPPLPGLLLDYARRRAIDPSRLTVVGTSAAHRRLAAAVGASFMLG
jgi:hypothetical protein